jgi:hypothetical protein
MQAQGSKFKIVYKNETKNFRKPNDYESLVQQTIKAFGSTLPKQFKFFYTDPDGDLISISCQEDLEEAFSSMINLKLVVESSIHEARSVMESDFSIRSSLSIQQHLHHNQQIPPELHQAFEHIPGIPHMQEHSRATFYNFENIG